MSTTSKSGTLPFAFQRELYLPVDSPADVIDFQIKRPKNLDEITQVGLEAS